MQDQSYNDPYNKKKTFKEDIDSSNLIEQTKEDMRAYAIYVARFRAIPDITDGLKPLIRKIIYCLGNDFRSRGFVKTASVTGRTIEKYSPHGDASLVNSMRNMIKFSKVNLADGGGAWSSRVNENPAAPRYTEIKISQFAIDVFMQDIYDDPRSTDWIDNYDKRFKEPLHFPAKIPTLLILGQMGIAVGLKVSIPSHPLGEVIDTTIALIKNPKAKFCLIPDECMPCEIHDTDFQKINDTGMGTYIAQGIIDIGEYNNHPALFVRSLPDFTFFSSIKESINNMWQQKKMPYIVDMISRSDERTGKFVMEEVIILQKGADPYFVREFLYANTSLRQTRQVKLIVIKNEKLEENMSYREYLLNFINFRRLTVFRKKNAELQKYRTAIYEREFYVKVMSNKDIDKIIAMIRKHKTREDSVLIDYLIDKLKITTSQAKFLLKVNLSKLSAGHLQEYKDQLKEFQRREKEILDLLLDPKNIDKYIINEMLEIKRKYDTPRVCKIVSKSESLGIAPGTFRLVFTKKNFIRKIGENENITGLGNDAVNFILTVDNTDDILIFTSIGRVFKFPVHKIPLYTKGSNGIDIRILNKYISSNIVCAARVSTLETLAKSKKFKNFLFVVSRKGYIKKIDLDDIIAAIPSGIIFSKLDQGDYVKNIIFGPSKMDILVYAGPKVLRIPAKEVPYLKRSTKGNRVSTATTEIDGMNFAIPNATDLVIVTKLGFVNRIPITLVPTTTRGKAGTKVIKLAKATKSHPEDSILSIWPCCEQNNIVVNEGRSIKTVPVSEIKIGTTISSGVPMFTSPIRVSLQ